MRRLPKGGLRLAEAHAINCGQKEKKLASPNTLRRPSKPATTYIGPVQPTGDQWGFHFYQPASNPYTPLWFAAPTKSAATSLRTKLAKQPAAFLVPTPELLDAIKETVSMALNGFDKPAHDAPSSSQGEV
jgi:hypothetical protein